MVWQNMGKNVTKGQIYIIENKMVSITMVFKECLIELTLNNKRLRFEINLLMDFAEMYSFFKD